MADLARVAGDEFRISSSMSFIGRTSTHALAARLADWLCGLGDFERDYSSAAVFLQVRVATVAAVGRLAVAPVWWLCLLTLPHCTTTWSWGLR